MIQYLDCYKISDTIYMIGDYGLLYILTDTGYELLNDENTELTLNATDYNRIKNQFRGYDFSYTDTSARQVINRNAKFQYIE